MVRDHGHYHQDVHWDRENDNSCSKAGLKSSDSYRDSFKQSRAVIITSTEVTDRKHPANVDTRQRRDFKNNNIYIYNIEQFFVKMLFEPTLTLGVNIKYVCRLLCIYTVPCEQRSDNYTYIYWFTQSGGYHKTSDNWLIIIKSMKVERERSYASASNPIVGKHLYSWAGAAGTWIIRTTFFLGQFVAVSLLCMAAYHHWFTSQVQLQHQLEGWQGMDSTALIRLQWPPEVVTYHVTTQWIRTCMAWCSYTLLVLMVT